MNIFQWQYFHANHILFFVILLYSNQHKGSTTNIYLFIRVIRMHLEGKCAQLCREMVKKKNFLHMVKPYSLCNIKCGVMWTWHVLWDSLRFQIDEYEYLKSEIKEQYESVRCSLDWRILQVYFWRWSGMRKDSYTSSKYLVIHSDIWHRWL